MSFTFMTAPVVWAQRKDIVLVTVRVFDAVTPAVTSDSTSFTYTSKSANGDTTYNTRIELFAEIDETETKYVNRPRGTEIVLKKKDDSVWWPRLAKTTKKLHNVSVDWNKWVDSSDDEETKDGFQWDPSEINGFDPGAMGSDDSDDDDDQLEEVAPEDDAQPKADDQPTTD